MANGFYRLPQHSGTLQLHAGLSQHLSIRPRVWTLSSTSRARRVPGRARLRELRALGATCSDSKNGPASAQSWLASQDPVASAALTWPLRAKSASARTQLMAERTIAWTSRLGLRVISHQIPLGELEGDGGRPVATGATSMCLCLLGAASCGAGKENARLRGGERPAARRRTPGCAEENTGLRERDAELKGVGRTGRATAAGVRAVVGTAGVRTAAERRPGSGGRR